MPKKSKRRAKTGGGGGSGKVPGGGGGAGRGGADKKNQPTAAKNSDENSAGILTAGAVRMFSECFKQKIYSVPKNAAPILQVVSDLKEFDLHDGTPVYRLILSDGARCIMRRHIRWASLAWASTAAGDGFGLDAESAALRPVHELRTFSLFFFLERATIVGDGGWRVESGE